MDIVQPGIILFTDQYDACVRFYHAQCGLPVMFARDTLTCLDFGGAYLMVEKGGVSPMERPKSRAANPTVIRFNVADVEAAAGELREKGIEVIVNRYDWGTIAIFHDPDGNRCELKDAWPVVQSPQAEGSATVR